MNTLVDLAVAQANEAYRNSHIDVTLNLVYRGQVNYTESGSIETDLGRLQPKTDAYLTEVPGLRDAYSADVVTLITETGGATYAGLGYVLASVNPAYSEYAFNVVRRAYASGYCVLAHEVGHNMGCMHDADNSATAGAYPYSYGYRWNSRGTQYRDIMAYAPGSQINYFSNPDVSYLGAPTGVPGSANAALTISNTAASLAAYRARIPLSIKITSPNEGSTLHAPANVILNASVDGSTAVTKVEFYNGSTLLGSDATAPYCFSWNPVVAGTYSVSAKVYTKTGPTTVSAPVNFTSGSTYTNGGWGDLFLGSAGVTGKTYIVNGDNPVFTLVGTGMGIVAKEDGIQFSYVENENSKGDARIRA